MSNSDQQRTSHVLDDVIGICRNGFIAVVLFSMCINILMLTAPLYMLQVFDRVLSSRSTDTLFYLSLIAVLAFITLGALEGVRGHVMTRLGVWLDRRLGGTVLATSIGGTLREGRAPSIQGLRDLSTLRNFLTGSAMFSIMDAPWTPIFLGVIFLLHPLIGWLALVGAINLLIVAIVNEVSTRKLLKQSNEASIQALRQAETAVRNADVIEAMGMMKDLVTRWNKTNDKVLAQQADASLRGGRIAALAKFLRLSLQIAVLGSSAWLVLQGEMTPGAMIATSILMGRALAPVDQAITSWKSAIAARDSYGRLRQHLASAQDPNSSMPLPRPEGHLTVQKMGYVYPGIEQPILLNITFNVEPGEVLGVVGPTAAGKTTLARLLIGNLRPQAGHIRLDGAEVGQWDSLDLGQYVGYLPQTVELFGGTVRENIARMGEGDPEEVIAAAQAAGVHAMILELPNGYDTDIGEGGTALSGGQRQRIGLARAVYGQPQLVVLDEPNASLDQPGELALQQAISSLKNMGATIIVNTHRPNLLRLADKVVVLKNHTVQYFGPRDEVLSKITKPADPAEIQASKQEKSSA